jgi:hypothetical protein
VALRRPILVGSIFNVLFVITCGLLGYPGEDSTALCVRWSRLETSALSGKKVMGTRDAMRHETVDRKQKRNIMQASSLPRGTASRS